MATRGQEVVGQEHRLRVLQMGPAGHDDVEVVSGLGDEGVDELEDPGGDRACLVAEIGLEQRGDLVVARPTGAQPTAHVRADLVDQ